MKKIIAIAIVVMLCGCQTTKTKTPVIDASVVESAPRTPPADAIVECDKVAALEDDSFGALLRKFNELLGVQEQCASKHKQLIDFILDDPKLKR